MKPRRMTQVIGHVRYDTDKAKLIADDVYWDGHNWERHGRNTFLYMTPHGRYFAVRQTLWQGEMDTLEPLEREQAEKLFERMAAAGNTYVPWEEAFPDIEIREA